jgi:iron complex outermembrane recepter protein
MSSPLFFKRPFIYSILGGLLLVSLAAPSTAAFAQGVAPATGAVRGTVTLESNGDPLHGVTVTVTGLKRTVDTGADGAYEITDLPPGTYSLLTHLDGFPDAVKTVTVTPGGVAAADFRLRLTGIRDKVTITATGEEQSTFSAVQSVTTLDNIDLTERAHPSLGDVLEYQPGVAKRSFGPGSTRPVVRGFDGDRVLVLQDGMQIGSLGSQSGDHGEPIDALSLDRVEIVKGPSTLLYGSNAVGGIVNAISGHNLGHEHPHHGLRGFATGIGGANGTSTAQGGVAGGLEYGTEKWLFWGNGNGQYFGDYTTPIGRILNSNTRSSGGSGGFGRYGERAFFNLSYGYDQRRFGVPFAGVFEGEEDAEIDLDMRRHNFQASGGVKDIGGFLDSFRLALTYNDYRHRELETEDGEEEVGTVFDNSLFVYRGVFDQKRAGRFSGSFGFWGQHRDYVTVGAEALAPPTKQNSFAVFGLEQVDFSRVTLQFAGRVERNNYDPTGLQSRSFTGFSGAAGARFGLWEGGNFVVNYSRSYRAPALEELYNNGPHIGTLTFEVGNANLRRERGDGIEFSLRHANDRLRAEANFFVYALKDYIFLAPTGEIEDGLPVADYAQGDARYVGTEVRFDARLVNSLWFISGLDYVRAELTENDRPLPRIPPLRGRVGFDWRVNGFNLRPEVIMARDQSRVFTNETPTAGYALFNLHGSYTIAGQHAAHVFAVTGYNLTDRLYRNHLSFIKELAPEIGRGVRLSYTLRFF